MTARAKAAQRLLQLLAVDLVGDLLDDINSDDVRRRLRQVQTELRGIAADEISTRRVENTQDGGTVALACLVSPSRSGA